MKTALVQKSSRLLGTAAAAFLIAIPLAEAGNESGHGGVSIVCRTKDNSIKSVELLDTFEGNHQYNLKIGGSELPVEDQIEAAQNRLSSRTDVLTEFQNELAHVQAHIHFLKEGVGLNPTDDAFPVINKKGCKYEQLAVYTDAGQVLVDAELFGFLSKTDQAALYVHETIFKMARARGAKSSVEARKLTAYLFIRPNQPAVIKELLASMFAPPAPSTPPAPEYIYPQRGTYRTNVQSFSPVIVWFNRANGTLTTDELGSVAKFSCSVGTDRTHCVGTSEGVEGQSLIWISNHVFYWVSHLGKYTYNRL